MRILNSILIVLVAAGVSFAGSYEESEIYKHSQSYPTKNQAQFDQVMADIYSRSGETAIRQGDRSTGEHILNQAFPYQSWRGLGAEARTVINQMVTGSYDWDSHKDTIVQRYRGRSADLGRYVLRKHDRGVNPVMDFGADVLEDIWTTKVMPEIFNLK